MTGPTNMPPRTDGSTGTLIRRPPQRSIWWRLVKSRRVRAFFLVAVVLHLVAYYLIDTNETVRGWFFGEDKQALQVQLTDAEIERAKQELINLNRNHFATSLQQIQELRLRLDNAQKNRLKTVKAEDVERKQKIADGVWPDAEKPDKTAQYFDRVDVDPPAIDLKPVVDVEQQNLVELYQFHQVFEADMAKLFERYHAIELSTSFDQPLPLSKSIEVTKLDVPKRRSIRPDFLATNVRTQADLDAFRKECKDYYLETRDILNNAARWVEMAESRSSAFSPSTLFGAQANVIPAPEPYYGHFLNPRLFRQVEKKQVFKPAVALGTRIGKGELTDAAQWVSLDRWYYIGPFAHPGKQGQEAGGERRVQDLFYKYPPESGIDLDATYVGRDNRELRWKYRAIGRNEVLGTPANEGLKIMPYVVDNNAYAIWYFYTEVWSDEDRVIVASFDSDDFGACWLNGNLVYQSPPDTQPWVPFAEGSFRVVRLRKGFNRVLFKLENWTGETGFNVLLMTHEDKELIKFVEQENRKN